MVDSSGNLIICDTSHSSVEVLAESAANPGYVIGSGSQWQEGSIYLIAGGGSTSPSTAGAPALSVSLNQPGDVAIDAEGNVLIADTQSDNVSVVAVSPSDPGYGITSWTRGDFYVIAGNQTTTPVPTGVGAYATTFGLDLPDGLAVDRSGNLVISDSGANRIVLLAVSTSDPGYGLPSWTQGYLYLIAGGGSTSPSPSGVAALSAKFSDPEGVTFDSSDNLVVADSNNNVIEVLAESSANPGYPVEAPWIVGEVYVIAGGGLNTPTTATGVISTSASLGDPTSIVFDQSGDLVLTDASESEIYVLSMSVTDPGYAIGSSAVWRSGDLYVIAGGGANSPSPSGTEALVTALNVPNGVATMSSGAVVIADTGDSQVEELVLAPVAPTPTNASPGDGSVSLSWSAPAESGGSQVSDYEVLVFDDSGALQRSIDVGSAAKSYVIGGLNDGARYSFEVEAVNSIGTSAPSAALSAVPVGPGATTLPPPPVTLPVPTSLPSTTIAPGSAHPHHATKEPLARVDLVKKVASVRYGFTSLLVRCTASRCTGTLRIVGKRVVHFTQHGIERAVTETYLASSDHFDLHGRRNVSVLVPLGSELSSLSKTGPRVVTAEFSVAHGKSAHYRLVLSAG